MSPATPRIAEIASGTPAATWFAPSWAFSAGPESPRKEARRTHVGDEVGQVMQEVAQAADERHEQQPEHDDSATTTPRIVTAAALARLRLVRRVSSRTGSSNSARGRRRGRPGRGSQIDTTAATSAMKRAATTSVLRPIVISVLLAHAGTLRVSRSGLRCPKRVLLRACLRAHHSCSSRRSTSIAFRNAPETISRATR